MRFEPGRTLKAWGVCSAVMVAGFLFHYYVIAETLGGAATAGFLVAGGVLGPSVLFGVIVLRGLGWKASAGRRFRLLANFLAILFFSMTLSAIAGEGAGGGPHLYHLSYVFGGLLGAVLAVVAICQITGWRPDEVWRLWPAVLLSTLPGLLSALWPAPVGDHLDAVTLLAGRLYQAALVPLWWLVVVAGLLHAQRSAGQGTSPALHAETGPA